ncbi:glutathione s-transferase-related protein-like protein [Talaromyces proteolyticus]|uniref:Glutathione s-transferase-related protein-like protein n=1 Tax=Talaromyces proteolyticus TaxID=1131652 RepID=A0AAD4Q0Q6_9EURO|nr:glutathione s-transferase-related protein-like protein [Talaromyces proteolyticus]KAH8697516.1 glutathione s-transferase-related protein-like protein [Talaromyces proteolyticus]
MVTTHPQIIVYTYPFSPWGTKIVTYLTLRHIPYAECHQPQHWPRPDIQSHFGLQYRRIPILAIGRDIYYDTLLILEKLEDLYPGKFSLSVHDPADKALTKLLEKWAELAVMKSVVSSLPPDAPLWKNETFLKDRIELWGSQFDHQSRFKKHPGALAEMRNHLALLEDLLSDGRQWLLNTHNISLADLHGGFLLFWLRDTCGALSTEFFSSSEYPCTWAFLDRYADAITSAKRNGHTPIVLDGEDAANVILHSDFSELEGSVLNDPTGLQKGQMVTVYRDDDLSSKHLHRDVGRLVSLTSREITIAVQERIVDVEIRVHCPRWQFVVEASGGDSTAIHG